MSSCISVSSSNTTLQTFVSVFVLTSESDDLKVAATFFCSARGTSFENAATSILDTYCINLHSYIKTTQCVNTSLFSALTF